MEKDSIKHEPTRVRFNRHTVGLAAMLMCMGYAAEAQSNGAAYLLGFLLASFGALSYLHARTNLRGLIIRAGSVHAARTGEIIQARLELRSGGRDVCGVELTGAGAMAPVFVSRVDSTSPVTCTLRIRPARAGVNEKLLILARSYFPLGVFTAERWIEVAFHHAVHPQPEGDLPLPKPERRPEHAARHAAVSSSAQGEGGDFAGVRAWQHGDPLRHVDWKAVARGRPMMVKQWSGEGTETLWLDWEKAPLPESRRAGQLAQWVDECSAANLRFGLRLPQTTVQPSTGPEHVRRCLDAIARMEGENARQAISAKRPPATQLPGREKAPVLERADLGVMAAALTLAVAPLVNTVAPASVAIYLASLTLCLSLHRLIRGAVSVLLRLLAVAGGATAIYLTHGSLSGLEPGLGMMLVMTAAKMLETRTPRDLQVLALLAWFFCLGTLSVEQDLGSTLYVLGVFLFITGALTWFRRGGGGVKAPLRVATTLFAQALPILALLFFLFPRGGFGLVGQIRRTLVSQSGISDRLDPGEISRMVLNDARAFRAEFVDGDIPAHSDRYWRCMVLWECKGLFWERGAQLGRVAFPQSAKQTVSNQLITLEPHGQYWLVALDAPYSAPRTANRHHIEYDQTLWSDVPVEGLRQYEVESRFPGAVFPLTEGHLRAALATPASISPAVRRLADSWRATASDDKDLVETALAWFRNDGFEYTLEPGPYGSGAQGLEDFLLKRKLGFCEHFSAGFATLMRLAGVPSRVVIGYLGGEVSDFGGYVIVRQSDAHAWTEVWLRDQGWVRVDPTAALAPGRLITDLQTYLNGGIDGAIARQRQTWWYHTLQNVRLAWDNANYQWYVRVVRYDEDQQRDVFAAAGLAWLDQWQRLIVAGVGALVILGGVAFWLYRPGRHPDPVVRAWNLLCKRLAAAGVVREPSEGPLDFSTRAAHALPSAAEEVTRAAQTYALARYGADPVDITAISEASRNLRKLKQAGSLTAQQRPVTSKAIQRNLN